MSKIEIKLKSMLDETFTKKQEADKQAKLDELNKDKQLINDILGYVRQRLFYKKLNNDWNSNSVKIVTEEDVLNDYVTNDETNKYSHLTEIKANTYRGSSSLEITVNGHKYYHLGEMFARYKKDLESAIEKTQWEYDRLNDKLSLVRSLETSEAIVKKLLKDYQKATDKYFIEKF